MMKKIMKFCFEKWWKPLLFGIFSGVLFFVTYAISYFPLFAVSVFIVLIALLGLLISSIYLFIHRKWIQSLFIGFCFLGAIVSFLFSCMGLLLNEQTQLDKFADNLTIPTDIQIENPLDIDLGNRNRPDSIVKAKKSDVDFVLYNSSQPGQYEYDLWLGKIDSGTVYLKVYEVTHNQRLTERSLSDDSFAEEGILRVANSSDSLIRFGTKEHFTIYEGDWGKPYAVRFEVWYKPDNGNERKLIEKNYKIEGWQF
ncbi:MAG: hypothetical protein PHI48_03960 [Bacteroidales bacterium]|nr:hypothetical protein [Bacteroidales bacterium]